MGGSLKILHTGDWQLSNRGTIAGRFVLRDGINQLLVDKVVGINGICGYAEQESPDLIVIAGDLFDHPNPENVAIKVAVEGIERLSDQAPVIIIKGNHEGGKGSEVSTALASFGKKMRELGVYVCEYPELIQLLLKERKVNVFCLPFPRKSILAQYFKAMSPEELKTTVSRKMEDVLKGFESQIEKDALNVLVGHFSVIGSKYSADQYVPPFDISVREEYLTAFDLVTLGHLHEPQKYYCGTIARGGFGEEEMPIGFKTYECGDGGCQEKFIELPSRKFVTVSVEDFIKTEGNVLKGIDRGTAVRIKGSLKRHEYDSVSRMLRMLNFTFLKSAIEVESEIVRVGDKNIADEPTVEESIRIWSKEKPGVERFLEKLVAEGKEIESRWREERRAHQ